MKEIPSAIAELAEKLGVAAELLWAALLKQAPISSSIELILLAVWFACMVVAGRLLYRAYLKGDLRHDGAYFAWLIYGTIVAILFIVLVVSLPVIGAGFFNPEYWALKQIIK